MFHRMQTVGVVMELNQTGLTFAIPTMIAPHPAVWI